MLHVSLEGLVGGVHGAVALRLFGGEVSAQGLGRGVPGATVDIQPLDTQRDANPFTPAAANLSCVYCCLVQAQIIEEPITVYSIKSPKIKRVKLGEFPIDCWPMPPITATGFLGPRLIPRQY